MFKIRFYISVLLILCIAMYGVPSVAENIILEPNLGTVLPESLSVSTMGGGSASVNDGKLLLESNGSGISVARVATPEMDLSGRMTLTFRFTTNGSNGENAVGILAGGKTRAIMTVTGNKVNVNGTESELDSGDEHYAVIYKSDIGINVWIDGVELYSGGFETDGEIGALYFSIMTRAAGVDAEFALWDLCVYGDNEYVFDSEIKQGDTIYVGGLGNCSVSFNVPLISPPKLTITDENGISTKPDFRFETTKIVLNNIELNPQMEYVITISSIKSIYGEHENKIIEFSTVPEGYVEPEIVVSGINNTYRTGNIMNAYVSADGANIEKTAMYIDGERVHEINGIGKISYTFAKSGTFEVLFEISDGVARIKSQVFSVTVVENEAPVIQPLTFMDGSTINSDYALVSITDDVGISHVEITVNGERVTVSESEGDVYTFNVASGILGDMKIKITASDTDGLKKTETYNVRLIKSRYSQVGDIVDYDNVSTGVDVWLHGRYTSEKKVLNNANTPDTNQTNALLVTNSSSTSGSTPYATKAVANSGCFRLSCDMYLVDLAGCEWMVRGSGSEFVDTVVMSNGKINAGGKTKQLETGRWYRMMFGVDTINQTYEFSVDGEFLTPTGGSPLPEPLDNPKITDIRINMMFDINQSVGFDNWTFERLDSVPDVSEVNFEGYKKAKLKMSGVTQSDIPDIEKNNDKFILNGGGESITPISSLYNPETGEIVLEFDKSLHSACDYELIFDASVVDVNGIADGEKIVRYFQTPRKDTDILNFEFIRNDSGVGARAFLSNMSSDGSSSAIMVLSVMDKNGEVISVRATPQVVAQRGEEKELYLKCESTDGASAEVLFINNWSDFVALKGLVNKINLK